MKKKRFTEEQIAYALAQETGGEKIAVSASTLADSVSSVSIHGVIHRAWQPVLGAGSIFIQRLRKIFADTRCVWRRARQLTLERCVSLLHFRGH